MDSEKTIDIATLSVELLQDEYYHLRERYQQLLETNEADTQRIYELKRSLETATAAEAYLSQELELMTAAANTDNAATLTRTQAELEEVRRKHSKLGVDYNTLQQNYVMMAEEKEELQKQLALTRKTNERSNSPIEDTELIDKRLQQLEAENVELLQKLEELQESSTRSTMAMAEKERNVEILRDQVLCLEENLRSKRDDLEDKTQMLESAQEQLVEANAKIAMLTAAPENNNRKGNSLFAEVDDQRQVMKQLLAVQKKSYNEMKKIYNESEFEIRRLKRENTAMHTELQACSAIFCNADKTYQDKLHERIRFLHNQNDDLERKLTWTQERLKELASDKGVLWLDSLLNFCKQETEELKKQLHSVRILKASLEEQLRNMQQDMARWRFESLRSRCVLLDRENLLNEHKISYKPVRAVEFVPSEKQLQAAKPRIVAELTAATSSETIADKSILECQVVPSKEHQTTTTKSEVADVITLIGSNESLIIVDATCEVKHETIDITETEDKACLPAQSNPINSETKIEPNENKESNQVEEVAQPIQPQQRRSPLISVKNFAQENPTKNMPPDANTLPGPSILSKQRDIFSKEEQKIVKFCAQEPSTIINLSPVSPDLELSKKEATNENVETLSCKPKVKEIRTKSNIIVRRIVIPSKRDHK